MYYSSIGMLAIILHLIINVDHVFNRPNVRRVKVASAYRYFLLSVLLYYFSDAFWGVLLDLDIIPLVYADTVLYFLSMGLTVLLWVSYIAQTLELDKKWSSILKGVGYDEVFARADVLMYERKKELKAKRLSNAGAQRA